MALHIQIFGAPGSGKSTMRSRLFYELKKRQLKVEEVVEVAKDDTYNERYLDLSDQIQLFGKQHHPHFILENRVDYIVTDSPPIMGITYMNKDLPYYEELKNLMLKTDKSYKTLNYFLNRNHEYQEFGRNQTEKESDEKAEEVKQFLRDNDIDFTEVKSGKKFIKKVLKDLGLKESKESKK